MGRIEGCIGVLRDCLPKLGDGVRDSLHHFSFLSLSLPLFLSYLISLSPSLPLLLFLSPSFPSFNSLLLSSPLPPLPSLSFAVSPLLAPSLFLFPTISFLSLPLLLFLSPSLTLSLSFPLSPPHPLPLSSLPISNYPPSLSAPPNLYVCVCPLQACAATRRPQPAGLRDSGAHPPAVYGDHHWHRRQQDQGA